jgi:hypothetical protein
MRTGVLKLLGAFRAKRTFIGADEGAIRAGQRGTAFFTYRFYFKGHDALPASYVPVKLVRFCVIQ